jgi:hypothetical protein
VTGLYPTNVLIAMLTMGVTKASLGRWHALTTLITGRDSRKSESKKKMKTTTIAVPDQVALELHVGPHLIIAMRGIRPVTGMMMIVTLAAVEVVAETEMFRLAVGHMRADLPLDPELLAQTTQITEMNIKNEISGNF